MLSIEGVDVYYGQIKALDNVSLTIRDGEIVVLIGSNGAGKSTIFKTICGLLKPRTGSVLFNKIDLVKQPVHKIVEHGICVVPEEKRVFRGMSVLENLQLGAFLLKARQNKDQSLEQVFELFPILEKRQSQKAGTLSGGEQQMLLIGRALMSCPKLLLIDELSLGLSPLITQNIFKVIKHLHETTGMTVFLVEQNVRMALMLADRGYIIENGRIVAEGKAQEFINSQQIKDAYFGLAPGGYEVG